MLYIKKIDYIEILAFLLFIVSLTGIATPYFKVGGKYFAEFFVLFPYIIVRKKLKKKINVARFESKALKTLFAIIVLSVISLVISPDNSKPLFSESRGLLWMLSAYFFFSEWYKCTYKIVPNWYIYAGFVQPIYILCDLLIINSNQDDLEKQFLNVFLFLTVQFILLAKHQYKFSYLLTLMWLLPSGLSLFRTNIIMIFSSLVVTTLLLFIHERNTLKKSLLGIFVVSSLIILPYTPYLVETSILSLVSNSPKAYNQIYAKTYLNNSEGILSGRDRALDEAFKFKNILPSPLGTGNNTFNENFDSVTVKNVYDSTFLYLTTRLGVLSIFLTLYLLLKYFNNSISSFFAEKTALLPVIVICLYVSGAYFSISSHSFTLGVVLYIYLTRFDGKRILKG